MKTINVKVDDSVKLQFDKFADDLGLSTSALLMIYIKKVLKENRIPFDIQEPEWKQRRVAAEAIENWIEGKKVFKGIAEDLGLKDEYDVAKYLKKIRNGEEKD